MHTAGRSTTLMLATLSTNRDKMHTTWCRFKCNQSVCSAQKAEICLHSLHAQTYKNPMLALFLSHHGIVHIWWWFITRRLKLSFKVLKSSRKKQLKISGQKHINYWMVKKMSCYKSMLCVSCTHGRHVYLLTQLNYKFFQAEADLGTSTFYKPWTSLPPHSHGSICSSPHRSLWVYESMSAIDKLICALPARSVWPLQILILLKERISEAQ